MFEIFHRQNMSFEFFIEIGEGFFMRKHLKSCKLENEDICQNQDALSFHLQIVEKLSLKFL